jgi:hypothetical protein
MKINLIALLFLFELPLFAFAQDINKIINAGEVERIENVLAADSMQGRKIFTPAIDKAADFISSEFAKAGLKHFDTLQNFRQTFNLLKSEPLAAEGMLNGNSVLPENIISISTDSDLTADGRGDDFTTVTSDSTSNFIRSARELLAQHKKYIVFVSSINKANFNRLKFLNRPSFGHQPPVIFVLTDEKPVTWHFEIKNKISSSPLANVVGMLPGKSKNDEYVIFSAHYDHLGIGKPDAKGDSIYNGANDDAAGTTAVIMLAKYFGQLHNNERTLIFVTFTAEEIGGFGSQYFSKQIDPEKAVAMFNIEMIGTESKWGKNSAYITGYEKSDFGKILQRNLTGSDFHFEPDPYLRQNLFYRSDNATLAALGVPAHTISTSKMDNELNYHKQSDEIATLDMNNMAEIIKAIALSSKTIVDGTDTPSRVEKRQ